METGTLNLKPFSPWVTTLASCMFIVAYSRNLHTGTSAYLRILHVFPENERQLNVMKNISTWFFEVPESTKFSKYNYFKISSILSVSIAINSLFLWLIAFIS